MEPSKAQGKRSLKYDKVVEDDNTTEEEEEEEEEEDEEEYDDVVSRGTTTAGFSSGGDEYTIRKKRPMITSNSSAVSTSPSAGGGIRVIRGGGSGSGAGGSTVRPSCQADNCNADLSEAKHYHRRHKICEFHAKASVVLVATIQQRFCQQCSRFHGLSEFDDAKRSCRRRLAGHNERRRKSSSDIQREGSN